MRNLNFDDPSLSAFISGKTFFYSIQTFSVSALNSRNSPLS